MQGYVHNVDVAKLRDIIDTRSPLGLFYALEDGEFTAVDNSTGNAWTESFKDYWTCRMWLLGSFEVNDD